MKWPRRRKICFCLLAFLYSPPYDKLAAMGRPWWSFVFQKVNFVYIGTLLAIVPPRGKP